MYHEPSAPVALSPMVQAAWTELEPLIRRVVREEHARVAAPAAAMPRTSAAVLLSPESLSDHLRGHGIFIPARQLTEMMRAGRVPSISLGIEKGARDIRRFYIGWMREDGLIDGSRRYSERPEFQRLILRKLSAGQIAAVLDVSAGHVRNMLAGGNLVLPHECKPGGKIRYDGLELAKWLLRQAHAELGVFECNPAHNPEVFVEAGRS